jgi:hypothetical protein
MSHDPLDDLLRPPSFPAPLPRLRQRVLEQTLREVRQRRRTRQVASAATLLACCAAGLWLMVQGGTTSEKPPRPSGEVKSEVGVRTPVAGPVELEWQALDRPEEAAQLYREAGDGYLKEADPANALRAYANALDGVPAKDLEDDPHDNWLLTAIKLARKRESERCD